MQNIQWNFNFKIQLQLQHEKFNFNMKKWITSTKVIYNNNEGWKCQANEGWECQANEGWECQANANDQQKPKKTAESVIKKQTWYIQWSEVRQMYK